MMFIAKLDLDENPMEFFNVMNIDHDKLDIFMFIIYAYIISLIIKIGGCKYEHFNFFRHVCRFLWCYDCYTFVSLGTEMDELILVSDTT